MRDVGAKHTQLSPEWVGEPSCYPQRTLWYPYDVSPLLTPLAADQMGRGDVGWERTGGGVVHERSNCVGVESWR